MKHLLQVACVLATVAIVSPSFAASPENICPNGDITILRVSTIKDGGSRAGFDQAAKDHEKWYRDHGFKDNEMKVANVISYDMTSKQAVVSKTEVMTIHMNPPGPEKTNAMRDAAWDGYVAAYKKNSDITKETIACIPKK